MAKAMHQQAKRTGGLPTTSEANTRNEEERKIIMSKAIKPIMSRPCILSSKKVMLYLREHLSTIMMKQLDTVVWAMIGANRNDIMTDREIRDTIRKAKDYVKTQEFEDNHKKRLDHILIQLEQDKKLDYTSPPHHARTGQEAPGGL